MAKCRYWSHIIMAGALLAMLLAMMAGVIILANDITVNTPLGSEHLPDRVIYTLIGIAIIGMALIVFWFFLIEGRIRMPAFITHSVRFS